MMEDSLLIDAVERFATGQMSEQEKIYFEDLRKNNPELDHSVVEHLFFLNELNKFVATKNFKHSLHEVESQMADEGFVFRKPINGKAKVGSSRMTWTAWVQFPPCPNPDYLLC